MWKLKVGEGGKWLMSGNNHVGRQHWEFDPDAGTHEERAEVDRLRRNFTSNRFVKQQSSDALMRMQMRKEKETWRRIPEAVKAERVEDVTVEAVTTTLRRGVDYICSIQAHDGHWPAVLAGNLFLLPQLIMGLYITGGLNTVLSPEHKKEMKRYIYNHQNEDGGWGLHIEGHSTMFGSTFNYVALRLLGEGLDGPQSDVVSKGRNWILDHGDTLGIPSWGKFFLAGTPGSQTWDATLAVQAILSSNLVDEYGETLYKAHDFIKASQVMENPSQNFKKMYRYKNKGAWTFCTQDHGWQASDCTGDALKVVLLYSQMPEKLVGKKIKTTRLYDAIDVLLNYQSKNGGFPVWEPMRTYHWFEKLNPTGVFENCLVEKEYVECTSSIIQALSLFKKLYPSHRKQEIDLCIKKALQYILEQQNPDGSWRGSWGICYTYGTWLAMGALTTCGMSYDNSFVVRKACNFLLSKQLSDGGWGESYLSYTNKVYTNIEGNRSNLVQTSWALLALIKANQGEKDNQEANKIMGRREYSIVQTDPTPVKRGVKLLINSQEEQSGEFPQQETTGSFFNACILHYAAYRDIFPVWALGEYRKYLQTIELN